MCYLVYCTYIFTEGQTRMMSLISWGPQQIQEPRPCRKYEILFCHWEAGRKQSPSSGLLVKPSRFRAVEGLGFKLRVSKLGCEGGR